MIQLLQRWLSARLSGEAASWLDQQCAAVADGNRRTLFLSYGLMPRRTGKSDLGLTADELSEADSARPGWDPSQWTIDQLGRARLLLACPHDDVTQFVATLDQLAAAGSIDELVALYQSLALLPHAEAHRLRAAEGIRTNMKAVFCAVAHRNPYPSEQLDEGSWNQMILKCLFVDTQLFPVVGLDQRSNPALMKMLVDYAHERWAAHRQVSPELWRPVGPYADDAALDDLERVLSSGSATEQQAAALALASCPDERAATILANAPQLEDRVKSGQIGWDRIAAAL